MEMAQLPKFLSTTLGPVKVVFAAQDNVTVDENGIHITVSIDRVTLAPIMHKEMTELPKIVMCQTQIIAETEIKQTETTHA